MALVTPMKSAFDDDDVLASPVSYAEALRPAPVAPPAEKKLEVFVIFTDPTGTLAALAMAEQLAQQLGARIRLLVPWEVHYALPLTEPAVSVKFLEEQVRYLASQSHLEVEAQIYLCRDKQQALRMLLPPHSPIVVGGRSRWWRTPAQRLAQACLKAGHQVVFADVR